MAKDRHYQEHLRRLQIGLVRYQQWAIKTGDKALVLFEGRDGAGKDGTIARITAHLAPRNTRVVSLPKPTERNRSQWYFQRYVSHLPAAGELVLFNRSWYNRAGVEPVMGYCTPEEHAEFLREAPAMERMLEHADIHLVKVWLDISKKEQADRLDARQDDPLKRLKISDLDRVAQTKWKAYSQARNEMLMATDSDVAPWVCVRADQKKTARLNVIRHLLHALAPADMRTAIERPDPDVLFRFELAAIGDGRLAK